MRKITRTFCYPGLLLLFLGLLLIFSPFGTPTSASAHAVSANVSSGTIDRQYWGKVIVVSVSEQWLTAYQNGRRVFSSAVLTGRPSLPTPLGTYHIFSKLSPAIFHAPYPRTSAYWYPPTHIKYAMEWRYGGYYLHDSWWHTVYGAGTNGEHYDPTYGWQQGSHGCVSMPLNAAAWLYHWAPIGTTVKIIP
ncbi:MAG TPA: L,D-transpeptidase [Ktedonobacteraceae bacterium]